MSTPMTPAQARVADPVLTNVARGYRNADFAATHLFPIAMVGARGGKVVQFGAEHFSSIDTRRAPGENRQQVEFGYESQDYSLTQHALDGKVPLERLQDARAVPGIDLGMATIRQTADVVALRVEIDAAELATTAANYDAAHVSALAANARWDAVDNQDPAAKVAEIRRVIKADIGRYPNVMVAGSAVTEQLRQHPKVIDRIKYTRGLQDAQGGMLVTDEMLAVYFGVARYVDAMAVKGKPGAFEDVWGKNVVLAYSDVTGLADMGSPSFGYTYRLRNYPVAGQPWFDRDCDSWMYPYTTEDSPVIAGKGAGYLLQTVVD